MAYVLGMRIQFDSFLNTESILAGAEYATLTGNSNTRKFRGSGPWYDNWWYDYSSYDGRRWGAHSGSDSDDFIVYLGLNFKSKSFTTYFSKERKGLLLEQFPELKYELLFNYTQKINQNINLKVFLEAEIHDNYFFVQQQERTDMAILLYLEYVIK